MPVPLLSKPTLTEPRPATPSDSMAIPMRSRRLDLPHLRTPAITLTRSVSQKSIASSRYLSRLLIYCLSRNAPKTQIQFHFKEHHNSATQKEPRADLERNRPEGLRFAAAYAILANRQMRSRKSGSMEHAGRFVSLNWLNRMANHGLELLRRALARVGEVNLVM